MPAVERGPRPGTIRARVLRSLQEGKSHPEIVAKTGLSSSQVTKAKGAIYREGMLPPPSSEQRKTERQASHPGGWFHTSEVKDRIAVARRGKPGQAWGAIEKYARWGMCPGEIAVAVLQEQKILLSSGQISSTIYTAREKGVIPWPTKEESRRIRRDVQGPREEIQQRVALWLEVGNIVAERGLEEIPTRRDDWLLLIEFYQARKEMGMTGNNGAMTAFNRKLDEETLGRLQPWIYAIRDATSGPSQPPANRADPSGRTPAETFHRD